MSLVPPPPDGTRSASSSICEVSEDVRFALQGGPKRPKAITVELPAAKTRADEATPLRASAMWHAETTTISAYADRSARRGSALDIAASWECPKEVAYVEGSRRLRKGDFKGAAAFLEASWYRTHELDAPRDALAKAFAVPPRTASSSSITRSMTEESPEASREAGDSEDDDIGVSSASGGESSGTLDFESEEEEKQEEKREKAEVARRYKAGGTPPPMMGPTKGRRWSAASKKKGKDLQYEAQLPLQLCLVYAKMGDWPKIDRVVQREMDTWDLGTHDVRGLPRFRAQADEDRWVQLLIQRGVANAFMGVEHFARAKGAFRLAQRAQPRNRDAARGLQCISFLEQQLGSGAADHEACSSVLSALAKAVTPDPRPRSRPSSRAQPSLPPS